MKKKYVEPHIRCITMRSAICVGSFVDVQSFLGGEGGSFFDEGFSGDVPIWGD
ncbi:MAG: hypothetical protein KBT49_01725 [Bacteroidetes bacterium]|nr:hypothetical protein [Candidatus Colenecus caballi]